MSNAKIISIIDHENRALRSDVDKSIERAVMALGATMIAKLTEIEFRVKQLEDKPPSTSHAKIEALDQRVKQLEARQHNPAAEI